MKELKEPMKNKFFMITIFLLVLVILYLIFQPTIYFSGNTIFKNKFGDNQTNNLSLQNNNFECNSPYIQVGSECCLDKNDNNICDKDEGINNPKPTPIEINNIKSNNLTINQNSSLQEKNSNEEIPDSNSYEDSNAPILGNPNAFISIIEYSDFQCPFCERAHSGTLSDFRNSDYFKSGEVNLVYKHFPLNSIHPQAQKAAEASECANKQGKFWSYHNILFENQQALDIASLKKYALTLNLDTTKFNKCLDNGEATLRVNNDLQEASIAGGRGTPYFVLINKNGDRKTISGAVPYSNFEEAIKELQY